MRNWQALQLNSKARQLRHRLLHSPWNHHRDRSICPFLPRHRDSSSHFRVTKVKIDVSWKSSQHYRLHLRVHIRTVLSLYITLRWSFFDTLGLWNRIFAFVIIVSEVEHDWMEVVNGERKLRGREACAKCEDKYAFKKTFIVHNDGCWFAIWVHAPAMVRCEARSFLDTPRSTGSTCRWHHHASRTQ